MRTPLETLPLLFVLLAATAAPALPQEPLPIPPAAEELVARERARAAVETAFEHYRNTKGGRDLTDTLVRETEDLVAAGPGVVPFLINEMNQAIPDTFYLCSYALGFIDSPEVEPALRQALESANHERSQYAEVRKGWLAFSLALAGDAEAIDLLYHGRHESSAVPIYRGSTAAEAITILTWPDSVPRVDRLVEELAGNPERAMPRVFLLRGLAHVHDPRSVPVLLKVLEEDDPRHRREAVRALAAIETDEALAASIAALEDPEDAVRRVSALTLESAERPVSYETLAARLEAETDTVARGALYRMTADRFPGRALPLLLRAWEAHGGMDRVHIVEALEILGSDETLPLLRRGLGDDDARVSARAPMALRVIGTPAATDLLIETLRSPVWAATQSAIRMLTEARVTRAAPTMRDRLFKVELAHDVRDSGIRYRPEMLADGLVVLRDVAALPGLREARERQSDPELRRSLARSIRALETLEANGNDVDAWIATSRQDDAALRRLAYGRLAEIGGDKAARALAASFGRVDRDEGLDVLREAGRIDSAPTRDLLERVLTDPGFDEGSRWELRDMAAWGARRLGGPQMTEALERSVRRRGTRDPRPTVYYALLAGADALPLIEEHRISRMRYMRTSRGEEMRMLDRLVLRVRLGRDLSAFDRPPDQLDLD